MRVLFLLLPLALLSCASLAQPRENALIPSQPFAQTQEKSFFSASTNSEVKLAITYPPAYDSQKKYPLAIFLHGRGGDHFQFRNLAGEESLAVASKITPFLVIAVKEPRHSYWKNGKNSGSANMITQDLLRFLLQIGLDAPAQKRGLFGISMGGHGAIYLSQIEPKEFRAVYALSPVFRSFDSLLPEDKAVYSGREDFDAEDPLFLWEKKKLAPVRGVIEIGKDDPFLQSQPETLRFLLALQKEEPKIQVDLSRPGAHDGAYWRPAIKRALEFFAKEFSTPPQQNN